MEWKLLEDTSLTPVGFWGSFHQPSDARDVVGQGFPDLVVTVDSGSLLSEEKLVP